MLEPTGGATRGPCLRALFDDATAVRPIVVTYARPAEQFVEDWTSNVGPWPSDASVIVVGDSTRSAAIDSSSGRPGWSNGGSGVRTVHNAWDLSALLDAIAAALTDRSTDGRNATPILYFDSLEELRTAIELPEANSFLRSVHSRLAACDAVGYFALEDGDATTVASFASVFDEVVAVDDDGRVRYPAASDGREPEVETRQQRANEAVDDVLDGLGHARRRNVLYALDHAAEPLDGLRLSRCVAALECDGDVPSREQVSRVYTSLYHTHLPKLEAQGYLTFDRDADLVTLGTPSGEQAAARKLIARLDNRQ
ncbi:hypothetical protein [Natronococcus sp.]|uniref:DUF7504 family protein n=1 Tax=Natronococcus sp. TaxID=35747 RepID=UPI003A4E0A6A